MGAQAWRKLIARRAHQGVIQQGYEGLFELMNKAGGVLRGIRSDKGPDFGKVIFGLFSYSEGSNVDNRCLPF